MRKFAVLISGGVNAGSNYSRYINDLKEMYKTLIVKNGYAKSDIFVLYADGPPEDLDGDGNSEIHGAATLAEVNTLFQTTLPALITNQDMLFIFCTNHGGLVDAANQRARLWLWGGSIEDTQFANLVNNLNLNYLVVCMEQCYSGGFIDDLAGNNRVIATACQHDEVSWACDSEGNYDEFCYYWTAAVRGEKPNGQVVSADLDGDGHVSLHDAFEYAKNNDSRNEHPQYFESPAGLGKRLKLSGPILQPICRPGGPRPVIYCRPGSPTPRPICPGGGPRPIIYCRPGTPTPRPICPGGGPRPIIYCRPGTPTPRPVCPGGGPRPIIYCRPGTPTPRPICPGGGPRPIIYCRPGTPTPRPVCPGGGPRPIIYCRPGTPTPRPICPGGGSRPAIRPPDPRWPNAWNYPSDAYDYDYDDYGMDDSDYWSWYEDTYYQYSNGAEDWYNDPIDYYGYYDPADEYYYSETDYENWDSFAPYYGDGEE